ncbi:MAG: P-loop NTPase, partial [Candidatus Thorarchaeota archaeon]|nr:P-loop NTPase [Candidatus Thorarchaeota archaeon]
GKLDYLIIDMPPGISDTILDVVRFIKNIHFLLVTTLSKVAYDMVRKQVTLFKELN